MIFDPSPIQSGASPFALLAGLQAVAPAEEFATLLGREAGALASDGKAQAASEVSPATPIEAAPEAIGPDLPAPAPGKAAIARADALAATLTPAATPVISNKAPESKDEAKPEQAILRELASAFARTHGQRGERKDSRSDVRPAGDGKKRESDAAPSAPLPAPLVESPIAPIAAAAPSITEATEPRAATHEEIIAVKPDAPRPETRELELALRAPSDQAKLPLSAPAKAAESASPAANIAATEEARPAFVTSGRHAAAQRSDRSPAITDEPAPAAVPAADAPTATTIQGQSPASVATSTDVARTPVQAAPASADLVVDRQLDLVRNEQWLGELARDIADTAGDGDNLSFRLSPHQLGRLDVHMARTEHGLSLSIHTESESAQAILSAAQPRLADEIRAQGVKLADTQMFSGDMHQSSGREGTARPAPLIEAIIPQAAPAELPEPEQRDGRYA